MIPLPNITPSIIAVTKKKSSTNNIKHVDDLGKNDSNKLLNPKFGSFYGSSNEEGNYLYKHRYCMLYQSIV